MGTWNIRLYSNDTTCDVRDTYIDFLKQQFSNEKAYQQTYSNFKELMSTDEEPLFWYALADTQWNVGRLIPEVKDKALKLIELNGGDSLWDENSKKIIRWNNLLLKLKEKLQTPMPQEKVFKKPIEFKHNPWNVGDVYAYRLHTKKSVEHELSDKYLVFQKIGNIEYYQDIIFSAIQVFNKVFDTVPDLEDLNGIKILPLVHSPASQNAPDKIENYLPSFKWYLKATMLYEKRIHYPKKYLTFIGNISLPKVQYAANDFTDFFWDNNKMEDWLIDYYLSWRNYEY